MDRTSHPSEALLTTFNHDGFTAEIQQNPHSIDHLVGKAVLVFTLMGAVACTVLGLQEGNLHVWLTIAAALQLCPLAVLLNAKNITTAQEVNLDSTELRITDVKHGGRRALRSIELTSIRSAYLAAGSIRLALEGAEDVYVSATRIPEKSAEWLCEQISSAARNARERAIGTVAPPLLTLLDSRTQSEADRKMRLARLSSAN